MLTRLAAGILVFTVAASALGGVDPTLPSLVQQVRLYEEATRNLAGRFSGDRTVLSPKPVPTLRSDKPRLEPEQIIRHYEGGFAKGGRGFFVRYRTDALPELTISQTDGNARIECSPGARPNELTGVEATLFDATSEGSVHFYRHFGTFYPVDALWIPCESLSETISKCRLVGVDRRQGLLTFRLAGLTEPFTVTVDPAHPGEVRSFGFAVARNGASVTRSWRQSEFREVGGARVPTKLEYLDRYQEGGKTVSEGAQVFQLSDLRRTVSASDVSYPLKEGMALDDHRAGRSGRLVVRDGKLVAAPADYGSPEQRTKATALRIAGLVALVLAICAAAWVLIRRRR